MADVVTLKSSSKLTQENEAMELDFPVECQGTIGYPLRTLKVNVKKSARAEMHPTIALHV